MIGNPDALKNILSELKPENVPLRKKKKAQEILDREHMDVEKIVKMSKACGGLCLWAHSFCAYYDSVKGISKKEANQDNNKASSDEDLVKKEAIQEQIGEVNQSAENQLRNQERLEQMAAEEEMRNTLNKFRLVPLPDRPKYNDKTIFGRANKPRREEPSMFECLKIQQPDSPHKHALETVEVGDSYKIEHQDFMSECRDQYSLYKYNAAEKRFEKP